MNICNTYNVTTVPITKCEIILKKHTHTHTHIHKLKMTNNLSNPKNVNDPFIVTDNSNSQ